MEGNKSVEPGHKVVTPGAEGESSTALDNMTDQSNPYQPGMAPLAGQTPPEQPEGGAAPDGSTGGVNDAQASEPSVSTPEGAKDATGEGTGTENSYAGMSPADLRKLCKERGLKSATNISAENLIASLLEYDAKAKGADGGGAKDGSGAGDDSETKPEQCMVVLKMGATYHRGEKVFLKNKPTPCDPDVAAKLLRTGMFAKG